MFFIIEHSTTYRYSRPVFLEPHTVRLRPRCDAFQTLHEYSLSVHPEPAGRTDGNDAEGNDATFLWFDGLHEELRLTAASTVETLRPNPFDYLVSFAGAMTLPAEYPPNERDALEPFRRGEPASRVAELAAEISTKTGGETLAFLNHLNGFLYERYHIVVREEGDPFSGGETMERREASCRDLAILFLEVCRAAGIAGRFVSGYQEGDPGQTERFMHAWPEIYLPGAGWRGYDPTLGLAVSDRHVPLASGVDSAGAAPTSGSFRGTEATTSMKVSLSITVRA